MKMCFGREIGPVVDRINCALEGYGAPVGQLMGRGVSWLAGKTLTQVEAAHVKVKSLFQPLSSIGGWLSQYRSEQDSLNNDLPKLANGNNEENVSESDEDISDSESEDDTEEGLDPTSREAYARSLNLDLKQFAQELRELEDNGFMEELRAEQEENRASSLLLNELEAELTNGDLEESDRKNLLNRMLVAFCKMSKLSSVGPQFVVAKITDGADANAVDEQGLSALYHALFSSNVNISQVLIEHGANIQIADSFTFPRQAGQLFRTMARAGKSFDEPVMRNGGTLLHYACLKGYSHLASDLLEKEHNHHQRDNDGKMAIDLIDTEKHPEMQAVLEQFPSLPGSDNIKG